MALPIQLALTLKETCRSPETIASVRQIAARLGLEPTTAGAATVSCRVAAATFADLFGREATATPARPPGATDYGTPGGYEGQDLPVPAELAPYVDSIAVVPPVTRLREAAE